jgi:hypothetical protein
MTVTFDQPLFVVEAHPGGDGQVHVFEAPCLSPIVYCTAQTNSIGCVPQIGFHGTPSSSAASGFLVTLTNTRNEQAGLLFYGTNERAWTPWLGGTLCVQPLLRRTPLLFSGGSTLPVLDCSGTFSRDFNVVVATSLDPAFYPGQHVCAQSYGRDPAAHFHVNFSDALEFYLEP